MHVLVVKILDHADDGSRPPLIMEHFSHWILPADFPGYGLVDNVGVFTVIDLFAEIPSFDDFHFE